MPKYSFQDIKTSRKRHSLKKTDDEKGFSQKKLGVKNKNKWSSIKPRSKTYISDTKQEAQSFSKNVDYSRFTLWFVVFISVFILIFAFGSLFSTATVVITPKQEKSIIDGIFVSSNISDNYDIKHEVMILEDEESKEVLATEEREFNKKASGIIVVYNKYNSSSQRLIKNTRFETPDGKIYRIKESIVIPGMVKNDDGELVPGSVSVRVYADEPGEEYNIGLTDFSIPGFKNSPKYESFYARSKTEMTGGFSGILKYPQKDKLELASNELKKVLMERLKTQAFVQKPDNFVLYEDAMFIMFDDIQNNFETKGNKVNIVQRAVLKGVIFDKKSLTNLVARNSLALFEEGDIIIPEIENISFTIIDKEDTDLENDNIKFKLSGNVNIVWNIDIEEFKQTIVSTTKKSFQEILIKFPKIKKAEVYIRPFWKRTFPDDVQDIRVKEIIIEE